MSNEEQWKIERWAFKNRLYIYPERVDRRHYILIIEDGDKPPKRGTELFDVKKTDWADRIRKIRKIYYDLRVNGKKR